LQECFFSFGGVKMEILKINGAEKQFLTGLPSTLAELLEHLDIKAATAVAEIDGRIVERKNFTETKLRNGQCIELVRFVGGG
jgi:sulfur carrier protein